MSAIYGIAGGLKRDPHMNPCLPAVSSALRPRGPDDDARCVDAIDGVALGFRFLRTAIGEASPGVLFNEDGSLMMVRGELAKDGIPDAIPG